MGGWSVAGALKHMFLQCTLFRQVNFALNANIPTTKHRIALASRVDQSILYQSSEFVDVRSNTIGTPFCTTSDVVKSLQEYIHGSYE